MVNKLKQGSEHPINLQNKPEKEEEDYSLELGSPKGVLVRCEVEKGTGEFSLYKKSKNEDYRFVGATYTISTEPGHPTTIDFRTLTMEEERLKKAKSPKFKKPRNKWSLYVVARGVGEHKFKVKLVDEEE